jgi:hypothetical protein
MRQRTPASSDSPDLRVPGMTFRHAEPGPSWPRRASSRSRSYRSASALFGAGGFFTNGALPGLHAARACVASRDVGAQQAVVFLPDDRAALASPRLQSGTIEDRNASSAAPDQPRRLQLRRDARHAFAAHSSHLGDLPGLDGEHQRAALEQAPQWAGALELPRQQVRRKPIAVALAQHHDVTRRGCASQERCDADHAFVTRNRPSCRLPASRQADPRTSPAGRKCGPGSRPQARHTIRPAAKKRVPDRSRGARRGHGKGAGRDRAPASSRPASI